MKARFAVAFAALALMAQAPAKDEAADLLFETPQWAAVPPGTGLTYRFARKSANEAAYGPSFEDRIRLKVEAGSKPDERTVAVDMFSAERRMPAGPFEDVTTNPVLLLFLERHVQDLSRLLGANPRYLKNTIRSALRDRADVQATETLIEGRPMPARLVSVEPFAADPNKARMKGLEGLTYSFTVSPDVPGQIAEIHATAALQDGTIGLEEALVYDPKND